MLHPARGALDWNDTVHVDVIPALRRTPHGVRWLKSDNAVATVSGAVAPRTGYVDWNVCAQLSMLFQTRCTPHGVRWLKFLRCEQLILQRGVAPRTGCVDWKKYASSIGVSATVAPRTGCDKTRKYSLIFQTVLFLFCIKPTTSRYNTYKFVKTNFKNR